MAARLNSLLRKLRSASRQPPSVLFWLPLAWLLLGLGRAAVLGVPFKRIAPWLGTSLGASAWVPLASAAQERRALGIGRAIRLAARHTPWQSTCLPQALAARVLLGASGLPYSLCFGVMREGQGPEGLKAHAWVRTGRACVTGGESFADYRVMGCYTNALAGGLATSSRQSPVERLTMPGH